MVRRVFSYLFDTVRFVGSSPARVLLVLVAFSAGAVAGYPVEEKAFDYMWADYRFCDDCHVHDYANEAYERSVHFGLTTCHDCHLVPIRHYPWNLYRKIFDPPQTEADITRPHVSTLICTRCHSAEADDEPLTGPMPESIRQRVVKIDHSPLHKAHLGSKKRTPGAYQGGKENPEADHEIKERAAHSVDGHGTIRPSWDAGEIMCMDCHGSVNNRAHRFEATRDNCLACHEGVKMPDPRLSQLECRECHYEGFIGEPGKGGGAAAHE